MEIVKTIAVGLLLHGVFTISIPWLILRQTAQSSWSALPLGPARWLGALLIGFGVYLYVWSVARLLERQTSAIPGVAPTTLEISGWYARVRHPLLVGVVAILLGEAIAFASPALLAYALLYWLWLHAFVVRREEPDLRRVFGAAYDAYAHQVPRWLPRLRSWNGRGDDGGCARDGATELRLRPATLAEVPLLQALIAASARGLSRADYSETQIEAALGTAWGVDSELIRDGTYFVVEAGGAIVGCGGWSRRRTLFGADAQPGRQSDVLDPSRDAARIRAFFVHPDWARRGIGRALLERCEGEARAGGFGSAELMATLPGQRLYRAFGYAGEERVTFELGGGITIEFVPMHKRLA